MIVHESSLFNKTHIFRNRFHAGKFLSELISSRFSVEDFVILAIPAGGVPVGYEMAKNLGLKLKLIIVSKILFPWTTEAGFGAISMHNVVKINEEAISYFALKENTIAKQIDECRKKIERRRRLIEGISKEFFEYDSDKAILVDDGLASGFTMLTAIESARRFFDRVYVAVPTASLKAAELIQPECDGLFCSNLRDFYPYAVADAYIEWHDVSEDEMLELLKLYLKNHGNSR
ncbi:MAG: phosphoribosyltransferase [Archaeoglobus sp.]|nr:phosphoribosyltransferase [Archaeoglobus sp.]